MLAPEDRPKAPSRVVGVGASANKPTQKVESFADDYESDTDSGVEGRATGSGSGSASITLSGSGSKTVDDDGWDVVPVKSKSQFTPSTVLMRQSPRPSQSATSPKLPPQLRSRCRFQPSCSARTRPNQLPRRHRRMLRKLTDFDAWQSTAEAWNGVSIPPPFNC